MRELEVHGVHVLRYTCIATKVLSILCSSSSSTVWNPYQHHLINTLKTVKCCSARRIFKDFSPITSATDLPKFGISHLDLPLGPPTLRKKDRPTSHPHICANDKRWCTKKPKVSSSFYLWGKENLSHGESLTFFFVFLSLWNSRWKDSCWSGIQVVHQDTTKAGNFWLLFWTLHLA